MGILSFYLGIGNLGLLEVFLHPFMTGNRDTFLFLERIGKPCLTNSRGKSEDNSENGKSQAYFHCLPLLCFHIVIACLMMFSF